MKKQLRARKLLQRTMRITLLQTVLIGLTLTLGYAHEAHTQGLLDRAVSIKASKVELRKVLSKIESEVDVKFVYSSTVIQPDRRVSVKAEQQKLSEVLAMVLEPLDISYRVIGGQIMLTRVGTKASSALPELNAEALAEQTVTGTVTDEGGATLPGVSILIKGTQRGTTTNVEGSYSVEVPDNKAVLVFSYVGYLSQEVAVENRTKLNVSLKVDNKSLEEVVVVGYGTARKKDLTGAIASVDPKKLETMPNTNAVQTLRGTVAGVTVIDNGRPGSDASILIRGRNSISASNDPLIVLDGVIYAGGRLSDINPGDIESIDILKDASSTAVYGSLAANGVIEITTKKGKSDKPRIALNSYYGLSNFAHIPDYLDAQQYLAVRKDAEIADGGPLPFQAIELANIEKGITIDPFEEVRRRAPISNHELSISGRSEKVNYYVSGSFSDVKAPVKGDNFKRLSSRLNLDITVTEWLNIGLNSGYSSRDDSGVRADLNAASYTSPYANLYYDDGVPRPQPVGIGLVKNALTGTLLYKNKSISNTLFANAFANITIPSTGLSYKLNVGYTQRDDRNFTYIPNFAREQFFNLGSGSKSYFEARNLTLENILKYNKKFGTDHTVDVTLLYGLYELNDEGSNLSSNNIFNDALGWNSLEIGENYNVNTSGGKSQQLSTMGRIGYRYKGKYNVDMSLRRDGYSAFGQGNKFGLFPAVGFSWNMMDEPFLADVPVIDNLKLRISWGKNGNRGVSRYSSLSNVSATNYVFGDGAAPSVGLYTTSMANPNLGWETTTSTNLGTDFGILKNRISGSVDFYNSKTSDLLLRQTIPNTVGFETFLKNIGATRNWGLEINLNSVNVETRDFSWNTSLAFSFNRNKIIKLTGRDLNDDGVEDDDIASNWFIGQPLGSNFDYVFDGIFQTGDDLSLIPGAKPGHVKFKDLNGDGKITPDDRSVINSNQPTFLAGLTNTFRYKAFSLISIFNTRQGGFSPNSTLNPGTNYYDLANVLNVPYWTPDNPINTNPAINYRNPLGYRFYQSRSFVRLQDVSLIYQVPRSVLDKVRLASLQIYASGKNLVTWTKWNGWDPEHGAGGREPGENGPLIRSYTLGLKVQL